MNFMKCVLVISAHFSTQLKTKCNNVEKCLHLCLFNFIFREKSKSFKNSLFIDIYIYLCVACNGRRKNLYLFINLFENYAHWNVYGGEMEMEQRLNATRIDAFMKSTKAKDFESY